MRTKYDNQKRHAIRRLYERYEIAINDNQYQDIVNLIQRCKARFILRQSNRVTAFEIEFKQRKLIALYDSHRKSIITFLPEGTPDNAVGNPDWNKTLLEA